jgi:hypothetical protein
MQKWRDYLQQLSTKEDKKIMKNYRFVKSIAKYQRIAGDFSQSFDQSFIYWAKDA